MRLTVLLATAFLFGGCAPYYEEVPAFGESDPNQVAAQDRYQQQAQPQLQAAYDNQAQQAIDPGQAVNNDDAQDYTDTDPSALTDFKSTLDPYGTWSDDAQYGTVWQPDPGIVGSDFAPYVTGGHWGYDNDYVWVSDYDWGWAPFHYGRWTYIPGRGWSWIPGRRYAGAWVSWRTGVDGYGYVGWGPMAPSWYWRNGLAYDIGWGVTTPYTFCRTGDLFSPSLHGRVLAGPEVSTVANNTHAYTEGRTPAHPVVGPPLGRLGVNAPPFERSPGYLRAVTLAHHPGVGQVRPPTQVPHFQPQGTIGGDHPVATAPRFNGVPPQTYRGPIYRPYSGPPPLRTTPFGGGAGAPPYRAYGSMPPTSHGAPPVYDRAPPVQHMSPPPVYRGGGGGFTGGGGYHAPSTSTYTHSHSYSHSSGGGRHR